MTSGGQAYSQTYNVVGALAEDDKKDVRYRWDGFGRLTKVERDVGGVWSGVATYRYDALNRRVEKALDGTQPGYEDQTTRYFYDGWRAVEERAVLEISGSDEEFVRARFGFGIGLDEVLWMDRDRDKDGTIGEDNAPSGPAELRQYFQQDATGSVVASTQRDGGPSILEIAERFTYTAYGHVEAWDQAWSSSNGGGYGGTPQGYSRYGLPYLFTGQRLDPESGLAYFKNRMFDPEYGRFISRDPLGLVDGPVLYAYASGNPVSFNDPTGLYSEAEVDFLLEDPSPYPTYRGRQSNSFQPSRNEAEFAKYAKDKPLAARATLPDVQRTIDWSASGFVWRMIGPPAPNTNGLSEIGAYLSVLFGVYEEVNVSARLPRPELVFRWIGTASSQDLAALLNNSENLTDAERERLVEEIRNREIVKQGALAVAEVVGSTVPGVGEAMDLEVVFGSGYRWWERGLAAVSLGANVLTGGLAPNAGAAIRASRRAGKIAEAIADAGTDAARAGDNIADAAADASRAATDGCFAAGTLVETRRGLRPVEEIRPGDEVLSRDDRTGETAWRPVVRTFVHHDKEVLRLVFEREDGTLEEILATEEHPFWTEARKWVHAQDLVPGVLISTSTGGWVRLTSSTWVPERMTVYNFEVADFHTYFVGETGLWVHNDCLPNDVVVCRGGSCTGDRFAGGSGVTVDAQGNLQGVSVGVGDSLESASRNIPHKKVGVTTVGDVRAAGGNVVASPSAANPSHATLSGITPEQAEHLFRPVVPNPNGR